MQNPLLEIWESWVYCVDGNNFGICKWDFDLGPATLQFKLAGVYLHQKLVLFMPWQCRIRCGTRAWIRS